MTVDNDNDLEALLRIGRICGLTLQHMLAHVEPGITTQALDAIGAAFLAGHQARSAPILAYRFPGHTCISINDEAAHGIPGDRVIQPGDMVNVDVSAELEGYWADTAASMVVAPADSRYERLCRYTRAALDAGIDAARAGNSLNEVGRRVESVAHDGGYRVIYELGGHGVGRGIHEPPTVFNFDTRRASPTLQPGMVFTIEPFLSLGSGGIYKADDGWTLKSRDGSVAAQYEHTVIVTADGPPILATAV